MTLPATSLDASLPEWLLTLLPELPDVLPTAEERLAMRSEPLRVRQKIMTLFVSVSFRRSCRRSNFCEATTG